ncbi:MAG: hypothetical protein U0Y68_20890 [Blastocatellia bacterium]
MPAKKATAKPKPKSRAGRPNLSHSVVAQIIVALVMGEGSCATLAERFGCSARTVETIKAEIPEHFCGISSDDNRVIGQLIKLYLTEAITTCVSILQDLRSPEKLKKQSVDESLRIFGTFSDRIFLLAEAAERASAAVNEREPKLLESTSG